MIVGYTRLSRDEDKKNYVSIEYQIIVANHSQPGMVIS